MRRGRLAILLLAGMVASVTALTAAEARHRRDHDSYHDRWEDRRDARRAGVAAGAATRVIGGAIAAGAANNRYEECVRARGYDYSCDQQYYEDRRQGRRDAHRAAVTVGTATWALKR